jgi:hypothetical protein
MASVLFVLSDASQSLPGAASIANQPGWPQAQGFFKGLGLGDIWR